MIVNPVNAAANADRKFLADCFLKKVSRWPDDEPVHPVDLRADSAVRERFSEDVLDRSVSAVKSYWQQLIFSGRGVPPPELANDAEVVGYVLRHAGAVGYVSLAAELNGARVLAVR